MAIKFDEYPLVPLRDILVFNNTVIPLNIGRDKSIAAAEEAAVSDKKLMLLLQHDSSEDDPTPDRMYKIGVLAEIVQLLRLPDGSLKVLVEAYQRMEAVEFKTQGKFITAKVKARPEVLEADQHTGALVNTLLKQYEELARLDRRYNSDLLAILQQIDNPARMADVLVTNLNFKLVDKQHILELDSLNARLERICSLMEVEIGLIETEQKIKQRIRKQIEQNQRDYYRTELKKAFETEFGEEESETSELEQLSARIKQAKMSKTAEEKVLEEFRRLKQMNPMAPEASIIRNYLEIMVALPWQVPKFKPLDVKKAREVLEQDHYGMEKVKERILEHLAVQNRVKKNTGPILCMVGPPGVGKTSLAESIAEATGRPFARISLGGVHDESEIRGHRRTYIGAMPGKIIQTVKKLKSNQAVILLDEIDKLGSDWRGDPASALLEVLDPSQNKSFIDHYLDIEYDLSGILFLATANTLDMSRPLLDRLEIIRLAGYSDNEKLEIAKRHLIPKQLKEHGLSEKLWKITDTALLEVIHNYTREAGVRNLGRMIAKLMRKVVLQIQQPEEDTSKTKVGKTKARKAEPTIVIEPKEVNELLGVQLFQEDFLDKTDLVGVCHGLAYTSVGGEMLAIEAVMMPGDGSVKTTGKLGEVMQESAQAALSYIKAHASQYGIQSSKFKEVNIHLHVPEGGIPKDGPSAGITIFTALVSLLTNIPVKASVAMTGEITLRGRVLAIGGLKEKLLAALRRGIKQVLIPIDNVKDLAEIDDHIKNSLEIIPVTLVSEVLSKALVSSPLPLLENEAVVLHGATAHTESENTPKTSTITH